MIDKAERYSTETSSTKEESYGFNDLFGLDLSMCGFAHIHARRGSIFPHGQTSATTLGWALPGNISREVKRFSVRSSLASSRAPEL